MTFRRSFALAMALGGMLLCGGDAWAGSINYLATGVFDSGGLAGTPTYTSTSDPSTSVNYTSTLSSASVPPMTNISLGTFTTASGAAPTSPTAISSGFTLTVTDLASPSHTITFTGTMIGGLSTSSSSAYLLFSSPLSQNLDGYIFSIVNADASVPGRVNLAAPTTNNGQSTINGTVTAAAVPEPTSIALLGLAIPAMAGLAYRRARRQTNAS